MIHTSYDRATPSTPPLPGAAARPTLFASSEEGGDGFADLMAHVDAGRIAVR